MKFSKVLAGLTVSTAVLFGTVAPAATADTAGLSFPAAATFAPSTVAAAPVKPLSSQLKAATATVKSAPKSVRVKSSFTVTAAATAKGSNATLQWWNGSKWASIATAKVNSAGAVSFKAALSKVGIQKVRIHTAASSTHKAAVSPAVAVKVLDTKAREAMKIALSKVGKAYRYGAMGPNAFDCSGLTSYAFAQAGVKLSRTARAQSKVGTSVSKKNLQPGDLVFFYSPISHVGIYIGNGKVVHAGNKRTGVNITKLSYMPFAGARRVG